MISFKRSIFISKKIKKQISLYKLLMKDHRTPLMPKILLALAIGYILLPFDIIPDFIPVLGQLDDIIIVSLLIYIALKLIPKELIEEYKLQLGNSNP
ncbi:MAG: DUF1232 domain-containing protein [Ignavibacteria bacterium]|jgi:uncharacterized membrane protein YkvA (DUF1232 family)